MEIQHQHQHPMINLLVAFGALFKVTIASLVGLLLGDVLFKGALQMSLAVIDASLVEAIGKVVVFAITSGVGVFFSQRKNIREWRRERKEKRKK